MDNMSIAKKLVPHFAIVASSGIIYSNLDNLIPPHSSLKPIVTLSLAAFAVGAMIAIRNRQQFNARLERFDNHVLELQKLSDRLNSLNKQHDEQTCNPTLD